MKSETSLVAKQVRLQYWSDMIQECQNRPKGVSIGAWCEQNGITKANYYYHLKCLRQECLNSLDIQPAPEFVELQVPIDVESTDSDSEQCMPISSDVIAVLHGNNGLTLDITSNATNEFLQILMGAMKHAE